MQLSLIPPCYPKFGRLSFLLRMASEPQPISAERMVKPRQEALLAEALCGMRDIRCDLEERLSLLEAQIAATGTDFDTAVEQLKNKLRADIASLGVALLAEQYRNYLADAFRGDGSQ
jgi:hypothetical protein